MVDNHKERAEWECDHNGCKGLKKLIHTISFNKDYVKALKGRTSDNAVTYALKKSYIKSFVRHVKGKDVPEPVAID